MVFKIAKKNDVKPRPGSWRIWGLPGLRKCGDGESSAAAKSQQQSGISAGSKLSMRLVNRRPRCPDTVPDFYLSPHWLCMLEAGIRSGCDNGIMAHLRDSEIRTLELIRTDLVAPLGRQQHHEIPFIARSSTIKLPTNKQTMSSGITNPKCAAFEFAIRNLLSDFECERVRAQRNVNTWILKLMLSMHWPLTSFFIAVHAIEKSMRAEFPGTRFDLAHFDKVAPLIAVASLLVAVSCECSHRELMRAKVLINDLPQVNNINDVITKQLSIVASLQNGCLILKTPVDWLSYYMARLQLHDANISALLLTDSFYASLLPSAAAPESGAGCELTGYCLTGRRSVVPPQCSLSSVWEIVLHSAVWHYVNNLHRKLEGSTLVAVVMWYALFVSPMDVIASTQSITTTTTAATTHSVHRGGGQLAELPEEKSVSPPERGCAWRARAEEHAEKLCLLIFNLPYRTLIAEWVPLVPGVLLSVQQRQWIDDFGPLVLSPASGCGVGRSKTTLY